MTPKKLIARLLVVVFGLILWTGMGSVVATGLNPRPDFPYDILFGMGALAVAIGIPLGFIWAVENA